MFHIPIRPTQTNVNNKDSVKFVIKNSVLAALVAQPQKSGRDVHCWN